MSEQEIDLFDMVRSLYRARLWSIGGAVAGVTLAVLYIVATTPIYESRFVIQIGSIDKDRPIEPADVLIGRMAREYAVDQKDLRVRPYPRIHEINKIGREWLVEFVVEGDAAAPAATRAVQVAKEVLQQHRELFARTVSAAEERLRMYRATYDEMARERERNSKFVDQRGARDDAFLITSALVEGAQTLRSMGGLAGQIADAERDLALLQSNSTRIVGKPQLPLTPVRPRRALALALGLAGGLLTGFAVYGAIHLIREVRDAADE